MNLSELSDLLGQATDVLRVETLDAYSTASDSDMLERYVRGDPKPDASEKQPWLDRLAAAAERGHPWRRLRVVSRPVPQYVRYACEFGYVDNVAAGEDVRVLDEASSNKVSLLRSYGDFYVADLDVVYMTYDQRGAFSEAWVDESDHDWAARKLAGVGWAEAAPFTSWWAANPDLHRDHPAAV